MSKAVFATLVVSSLIATSRSQELASPAAKADAKLEAAFISELGQCLFTPAALSPRAPLQDAGALMPLYAKLANATNNEMFVLNETFVVGANLAMGLLSSFGTGSPANIAACLVEGVILGAAEAAVDYIGGFVAAFCCMNPEQSCDFCNDPIWPLALLVTVLDAILLWPACHKTIQIPEWLLTASSDNETVQALLHAAKHGHELDLALDLFKKGQAFCAGHQFGSWLQRTVANETILLQLLDKPAQTESTSQVPFQVI